MTRTTWCLIALVLGGPAMAGGGAGRGQDEFGNEVCTFADQDQAPLNDYERANVRLIQSFEKRRGC